MTDIHDQYNPHQRLALGKIGFHVGLPIGLKLAIGLGVAVAWEIHEETVLSGAEEVQGLRSSRRTAGTREAPLPRNAIEHAGLARIGASCEGHFSTRVLGGFREARGAEDEFRGNAQPGVEDVTLCRLSCVGIGGVGVALCTMACVGRRGPPGHEVTLRNHGGKTLAWGGSVGQAH